MTSSDPIKDGKGNVELHEVALDEKLAVVAVDKDGFGARKKVDPKEIKLVRKSDLYMMVSITIQNARPEPMLTSSQPTLWLMYFLNFLDRNAMVNGKLNGLATDLNLKGTEYQTCVSILFVG